MIANKIVHVRAMGTQRLRDHLAAHPAVALDHFEEAEAERINFTSGEWHRETVVGCSSIDGPYGLVELMDNNPLVCADRASCPGPAATLALIGLGPLIRGGLLVERPSVLFSFDGDYDEVDAALGSMEWQQGATCAGEPAPFAGVLSATCLAAVRVPESAEEIDELYDEAYGRSFFVKGAASNSLDLERLRGAAHAEYALALTEGIDGLGMLRIQVLAHSDGKCGASQLVHMFNVMAGFEEDLGINS